MILRVLDELGEVVDEDNPIVVEHNGELGGQVVLPLTLENSSSNHYCRMVFLTVNSVAPVLAGIMLVDDVVPSYLWEKRVNRIGARERVPFNLQVYIPPNTPEKVVRGIFINLTYMAYPVY